MTVAEEIKKYLDSLGTLGILTYGFMPGTPNAIGTIYEYGGRKPTGQFGVAGLKYERPAIQIVFRGEPGDYLGPRNKAEIVYRALAEIQPGALGAGVTTEYLMVEPQQAPHPVEPVDTNNRHYIGVNFYTHKGLSV